MSKVPESIDPRYLIVQDGTDVGRIRDPELAEVGAYAQEQKDEEAGTQAMAKEVGRRAAQLVPDLSNFRSKIASKAEYTFLSVLKTVELTVEQGGIDPSAVAEKNRLCNALDAIENETFRNRNKLNH